MVVVLEVFNLLKETRIKTIQFSSELNIEDEGALFHSCTETTSEQVGVCVCVRVCACVHACVCIQLTPYLFILLPELFSLFAQSGQLLLAALQPCQTLFAFGGILQVDLDLFQHLALVMKRSTRGGRVRARQDKGQRHKGVRRT